MPRRSDPELVEYARQQFMAGVKVADIADEVGLSDNTVYRYVQGMIAPAYSDVMGDELVTWGEDNADAIADMKRRCNERGWLPQEHTLIVLAMAQQAREELAEQTGGIPPTVRAVLYRMMGVYGANKGVYAKLIRDTGRARKSGVWPRDYFTDSNPDNTEPRWHDFSLEESFTAAFSELAKPSDAFIDTPFVLGIVVEARGGQLPLKGAITQHLGFSIPVFASSGSSAISRTYNIEHVMQSWADQNDAEPIVLVITDYDPSGLVIANNLDEWLIDIETQRIGIDPHLVAEQENQGREVIPADDLEAIEAEIEERPLDRNRHRRSEVWRNAVKYYGSDTEYQVEALDYLTWAQIITGHLARLLEERSRKYEHKTVAEMHAALQERRAVFADGDALMTDLKAVVRRLGGDVDAVAEELLRPRPGNPWNRRHPGRRMPPS